MSDKYLDLVQAGFGKELAAKLGLPQPSKLRRYTVGEPLLGGTALILGRSAGAEKIATSLLTQGLDVRRHLEPKTPYAAVIVGLEESTEVGDLSAMAMELGQALKQLSACGRVIFLASKPDEGTPEARATQHAVIAMMRSVAHEMRAGSSANAIVLTQGADAEAPSLLGTLRFLLSGRSAYVSGQPIYIRSDAGAEPNDIQRPLEGKIALVTGAARGIGAAIARTLRRDGAQVIVVDVPAAGEALARVANEVQGTALQLDITAPDAGEKILQHAKQRYGWLDIVVHNAGITRDKLLANMDAGQWDSVLAVNLKAQLTINDALLASTAFAQDGKIVSLASTSGIAGNRGQSNYAASKAGVIGMVSAYADRLQERGGTINAVAPGFIETDMTAKIPFLTREVARRLSSLQQGGQPVDVAETIAFLVSSGASGINGETIRVCGQNLVGA